MDSGAEGDVPIRLALQVEPLGMRIGRGVHVGGGQHGHDPVALAQANAVQFDIPAHEARLCELHRRDEAQEFLTAEISATPVFLQPVAQTGVSQQLELPSR